MKEPADVIDSRLRSLWRARVERLVTTVATKGREHRELARAASLFRRDYHDRFLIELLQNANDQALRGGLRDTVVGIIRTENAVAVTNDGMPLTAQNLERLTALADSDKGGALVGNKGVGFKSVYQVTRAPEVYTATAGATLVESLDLGVCLALDPFEDRTLRAALASDTEAFLADNNGLAEAASKLDENEPWQAVARELRASDGFRFPLPRCRWDLDRWLEHLSLPGGLVPHIRTAVVLPLAEDDARVAVDRAFDSLLRAGPAGTADADLAVLFLPGVAEIQVHDKGEE